MLCLNLGAFPCWRFLWFAWSASSKETLVRIPFPRRYAVEGKGTFSNFKCFSAVLFGPTEGLRIARLVPQQLLADLRRVLQIRGQVPRQPRSASAVRPQRLRRRRRPLPEVGCKLRLFMISANTGSAE